MPTPKKKPAPKKKPIKYKDIKNISEMTEPELIAAIQRAVESRKVDMARRLVGRLNRVRGERAMTAVMGLFSYKGKVDVNAVLAGDR